MILTGSEPRHSFFRRWIALPGQVEVLCTYCEGAEKSLGAIVAREDNNELRQRHLVAREQSEEDFFRLFIETTADHSNPRQLPKGEINLPTHTEAIVGFQPDLVVAYGCSIIKDPLLHACAGRILNIHLGLSPYYRGSGTNYWPLVNGAPEYVGVTFMHMDAGVDTGEIIHQIRARIAPGDTAVQIGNRLILDMARVCLQIILQFEQLQRMPQPPHSNSDRYYKKRDYTEESVAKLHANFASGMVNDYLAAQQPRCAAVPLVENPGLMTTA